MAEARRFRRVLSGVAVGAGGVGYEQKLSAKPVEQRPPAAGLHWASEVHLRAQRWPTAPLSPLPLSRTLSAREQTARASKKVTELELARREMRRNGNMGRIQRWTAVANTEKLHPQSRQDQA